MQVAITQADRQTTLINGTLYAPRNEEAFLSIGKKGPHYKSSVALFFRLQRGLKKHMREIQMPNSAACSHTTCLMDRNRVFGSYLLVSDELGSATGIDRLLVSSGLLSTPIFTLIENDDFWSCHTDFGPKMSPKNGIIIIFLLDISARSSRIPERFRPEYALLCHGQRFQLSSPSLQWLTSFDFRKLYPLSAGPARMQNEPPFFEG